MSQSCIAVWKHPSEATTIMRIQTASLSIAFPLPDKAPGAVTGHRALVQRQSRVWRIVIATKLRANQGVWQEFGGEIEKVLLI
jgi:hypothetical protein